MKLDLSGLVGENIIPIAIADDLLDSMEQYHIDTPLRAAHFLAQAKEESQNFTHSEENLHYSAARLKAVFPRLFPSDDVANHYAMNPEMTGNRIYANKNGNADEISGDGYKFRGRGDFELTGRDNYHEFSQTLPSGIVLTDTPELVATTYAHASAAWFFDKHGLNVIADQGGDDPTKASHDITIKVNGGLLGWDVRLANFKQILPLIKIIP